MLHRVSPPTPRTHIILSFSFNAPATTEIYTLSLHDALPISRDGRGRDQDPRPGRPFRDDRVHRRRGRAGADEAREDRKSTRLNSSHVRISYAVFCLKKKNKKI